MLKTMKNIANIASLVSVLPFCFLKKIAIINGINMAGINESIVASAKSIVDLGLANSQFIAIIKPPQMKRYTAVIIKYLFIVDFTTFKYFIRQLIGFIYMFVFFNNWYLIPYKFN